MEDAKNPIEIEIINGLGYVWNARDVFRRVTDYRLSLKYFVQLGLYEYGISTPLDT